MDAVLVLGGDPPEDGWLDRIGAARLLIATDGGAAGLLRRGIMPHRIIGDMDSLDPEMEQIAVANGVHIERHPRVKAETDGELAMRYLLESRPRSILLLGGHGGRSAMFLSHVHLLRLAAEAGIAASLEGHNERLRVLAPGDTLGVEIGEVLDLLAFEPAVVRLEGFAYDGAAITLEPWTGHGISNPAVRRDATVKIESGLVLAIIEGSEG